MTGDGFVLVIVVIAHVSRMTKAEQVCGLHGFLSTTGIGVPAMAESILAPDGTSVRSVPGFPGYYSRAIVVDE